MTVVSASAATAAVARPSLSRDVSPSISPACTVEIGKRVDASQWDISHPIARGSSKVTDADVSGATYRSMSHHDCLRLVRKQQLDSKGALDNLSQKRGGADEMGGSWRDGRRTRASSIPPLRAAIVTGQRVSTRGENTICIACLIQSR